MCVCVCVCVCWGQEVSVYLIPEIMKLGDYIGDITYIPSPLQQETEGETVTRQKEPFLRKEKKVSTLKYRSCLCGR